MLTRSRITVLAILLVATSTPLLAATFTIVNADGAGEGLNDPTVVAPVGGNPGTTLGEQRQILLQSVADVWADIVDSPVEIRIQARFDDLGNCGVLGSTGQGNAFRDFPGAPIAGHWFHSAIADAITGADQNPGGADFFITYNSRIDTASCTGGGFYYGLDGNDAANELDLFPVILHEMGHGLGFANFISESNGFLLNGFPDINTYYTYDTTTGEHWSDMTNSERVASAVNTGNVVWDGPNATAAMDDFLLAADMELGATSPPAIAGAYAALGATFGGIPPAQLSGTLELVNATSGTPSEGCDTLNGFTAGNIALIDRGTCEFGVKALNAENAGAVAVVVANNVDGTVLVTMGGGVSGDQVTIPVVALGQNDGTTIKAQLPGVTADLDVVQRRGSHATGFPLLYAPNPVEPGSSISHWDVTVAPDLLMEPALSDSLFDQVDMTPALFEDVGHTLIAPDEIFADDFESGGTTGWSAVVP